MTIEVDPAATHHPLSVWDYCTQSFQVRPGEYTVYVGTSSEDTPFVATVTVS